MNDASNYLRNFPQINRELRGHDFYGEELLTAPDMYATEDVDTEDKMVIAHYFTSSSDWWVVEVEKTSGRVFCYVCLNGWTDSAEWGYADLIAMESMIVGNGTIIERDLHWTPKKFSEIEMGR